MSIEKELTIARKNLTAITVSCAGLEGSAEARFNQLHNRGADGRFGSGSARQNPPAHGYRDREIADIKRMYSEMVGETFSKGFKDLQQYFKNGEYREFQQAVQQQSFKKLESAVSKAADRSIGMLARDLIASVAAIELAPVTAAHFLIGRKNERVIYTAVADVVAGFGEVVGPLSRKGVDLFLFAEERFDRAITRQIEVDPDLSGKDKLAKLKAFNSAVEQFKAALENKTFFAPLVKKSAARLLISRLTRLGDREMAKSRVADISMDSLTPRIRKEAKLAITDFYQLVGQPLHVKYLEQSPTFSPIERGYADPVNGLIHLHEGIDIRGLIFHETGHFTNAKDPDLDVRVEGFVKKRTNGEIRSLKDDVAYRGYGAEERYAPDRFIASYVGKVYSPCPGRQNPFQEVMSVGLERFADEQALANFATRDPEHLDLILEYVSKQYQPQEPSAAVLRQRKLEQQRFELWKEAKAKSQSRKDYIAELNDKVAKNNELAEAAQLEADSSGMFSIRFPHLFKHVKN